MANRFVQAPSHGGNFRSGQPTLIVIHSLEAPARRGLAYDLATGWLQGAGVSPHALTDPGETVDTCSESLVGWHCGNGNQVGLGFEVTGYAAWSFEQWTTGDAFAAVRLDAKRAAEAAQRHGIPLRWLSLAQIRNGERGFCTHADISATIGGTNHTDPGQGFPYAIFMQMVQQFAGGTVDPAPTPNPQPDDGQGGADPQEDEMALKVVRCNGIDYAFNAATGVFFRVRDPDHYFFLRSAKIITVDHGSADQVAENLLEFIRFECARSAGMNADAERVEGYMRPDTLKQGDGKQTLVEAVAQTRNDVSAIKAKLGN